MIRRPCQRSPIQLGALASASAPLLEPWCLCTGWTPWRKSPPWTFSTRAREGAQVKTVSPAHKDFVATLALMTTTAQQIMWEPHRMKWRRKRRTDRKRLYLRLGRLSPETTRRETRCSGGRSGTTRNEDVSGDLGSEHDCDKLYSPETENVNFSSEPPMKEQETDKHTSEVSCTLDAQSCHTWSVSTELLPIWNMKCAQLLKFDLILDSKTSCSWENC